MTQAATHPPYEILLIEDSAEFSLIVLNWLEKDGFANVTYAADTTSGKALLKEGQWDLVISDIELPDGSGLDLVPLVKKVDRWVGILLMTAVQRLDYAEEAVKHHADGLLFKPFERDDFLRRVNDLVMVTRLNRQRQRNSVLAIGAHPDDVEIGCGGALAKHRANGDLVTILTLSQGASGGDATIRRRESTTAAQMLGAELHIGELVDTSIPEGGDTIKAIAELVRRLSPTHIYTHSHFDTHQDHRNTHHASIVAGRSVPNVYCYQAPSATVEFRPNLYIDISEQINEKLAAIGAYASQTAIRPYLARDFIIATARYWGRHAGYVLAEPLEVIRERGK